jgi:hypothetical protein
MRLQTGLQIHPQRFENSKLSHARRGSFMAWAHHGVWSCGVRPNGVSPSWRDTNGVIPDGVGPVSRQSTLVQAVLAASRRFGRPTSYSVDRGVA